MTTVMWILLLVAACAAAQSSAKIEGYKPPREPMIIPKTSFTCRGKIDGFYADIETNCRVFRYCQTYTFPNGQTKRKKWGYFCPPTLIFRQEHLNCAPRDSSFRCSESEKYYYVNDELYRPPKPTVPPPTSDRPPLLPERPPLLPEEPPLIPERPPLTPKPTSERPPLIPRPTTESDNLDELFPLLPPLPPSNPKPDKPGSFLLPPSTHLLRTSVFTSFHPDVLFKKLAEMAAVRSDLLDKLRLALTPADTLSLTKDSSKIQDKSLIDKTKEMKLPMLKATTRTKELLKDDDLLKAEEDDDEIFNPDFEKHLKSNEEFKPIKFDEKLKPNEGKQVDEKKKDLKLKEEKTEKLEKVSLPKFTGGDIDIFQSYIDALNEDNLNIFKKTFQLEEKEFPKSERESEKLLSEELRKKTTSSEKDKAGLERLESLLKERDEDLKKESLTETELKSKASFKNHELLPGFDLRDDQKKTKDDERKMKLDLMRDELKEKDKKKELKSLEKSAKPEIKITDLGKPILTQFESPLLRFLEPTLRIPVPATLAKPYILPETPLIPISFQERLHTIGIENIEPTLFIGGPSAFNSELLGSTFTKSTKDGSLKLDELKKLSNFEQLGSEDRKNIDLELLAKSRKEGLLKPEFPKKVPDFDEVPDAVKDRFFRPDFFSSFPTFNRPEGKADFDLKSLTKQSKPVTPEDLKEIRPYISTPDHFKDGFFSSDFLSQRLRDFELKNRFESTEKLRISQPEGLKFTRPETFGFGGFSEPFRADLFEKGLMSEKFDQIKTTPEGRSRLEDEPVGPR